MRTARATPLDPTDLFLLGFTPGLWSLALPVGIAMNVYPGRHDTGFMAGVMLATVCGPFVVVLLARKRIGSRRRAAIAGLAYGLGIVGVPLLLWPWIAREPLDTLVLFVPLVAAGAMGALAWTTIRVAMRFGRPVREGPVCAWCGYSMIGNRSGRCPECGELFVVCGEEV